MKIFLIGPGGVGKSTCGKILADALDYKFIDLDDEFCSRIENIGIYIANNGYEKYCFENSKLFFNLMSESSGDFTCSLSSGFLVHEGLNELVQIHKQALKQYGTSILLLPSSCINKSTEIVVKRQLLRGFGLKEDKERIKFKHRFFEYAKIGDIKIFSHKKPEVIVEKIKLELLLFNR